MRVPALAILLCLPLTGLLTGCPADPDGPPQPKLDTPAESMEDSAPAPQAEPRT